MSPTQGTDVLDRLVHLFGPAGGLAVGLLFASLFFIWWLARKYVESMRLIAKLHLDCEKEKRALEQRHSQDLISFKEACERRLETATQLFLDRDNQKRGDVVKQFEILNEFKASITNGLREFMDTLKDWRLKDAERRRDS